ncbi:response regulator [Dokdonia sinensis]|uniref:Response regulator n=1 Tax=Dokdonia sinensis TaxID=2479847 RepID=A0A3M0GPZ7_9FLAO|nr:response regulator [Dokdonia sinensis]RMB63249.1 response regulator [Dokdonia sinensis]
MKYPIELACIIDDDDMYISLITRLIDIKKLSKNLLIFKNGKEALDYFVRTLQHLEERGLPQVILLDLNMPVMDGWQFLTELGKYDFPALKETTLYIVSSSINPVDIERSKAISLVKDFLIKPVRPEELANVFMTSEAS